MGRLSTAPRGHIGAATRDAGADRGFNGRGRPGRDGSRRGPLPPPPRQRARVSVWGGMGGGSALCGASGLGMKAAVAAPARSGGQPRAIATYATRRSGRLQLGGWRGPRTSLAHPRLCRRRRCQCALSTVPLCTGTATTGGCSANANGRSRGAAVARGPHFHLTPFVQFCVVGWWGAGRVRRLRCGVRRQRESPIWVVYVPPTKDWRVASLGVVGRGAGLRAVCLHAARLQAAGGGCVSGCAGRLCLLLWPMFVLRAAPALSACRTDA